MTNYVPFQGGVGSGDSTYGPAGGYLLPPEQGEILVNGILVETGAINLAGDARSTTSRRTQFPVYLGQPDADFVGEGQPKPLTGAGFSQAILDIKKLASIIVFTDEMLEDLQNGDLNVLADAGVRQAIAKRIDQAAVGIVTRNFNSSLTVGDASGTPAAVLLGSDTVTNVDDRLQKAVSAAMGKLEANGYGDPANLGVLLGFGWQQVLRDARMTDGRPIYDGGSFAGQSIDPLYGLQRGHSSALGQATDSQIAIGTAGASGTAAVGAGDKAKALVGYGVVQSGAVIGAVTAINSSTGVITFTGGGTLTTSDKLNSPKAVVVHRPNLHVRVRSDVSVAVSNEATLTTLPNDGPPSTEGGGSPTTVSMFQNNLTAVRYETRLGFLIHDTPRAVVAIY
jgi:hypothetical protein